MTRPALIIAEIIAKERFAAWVFCSHWLGFVALVPFLIVYWIHETLGLSDAAMLLRNQLDRDSQLFNFAMIAVFWLGIGGFSSHAIYLAVEKEEWLALVFKFVVLALYWAAVLWLGTNAK